jgi:hypothetical protein
MTEPQDKIDGRRRFRRRFGDPLPPPPHPSAPARPFIVSPLPTSSAARKDFPLWTGALEYAPAAFALMARTSVNGNRKHNPGEPLHHARGKSPDHKDCILRHLTDYVAMLAYRARFGADSVPLAHLEEELGNLVWRAAMFAQEESERLGIAPRAPRAVLPSETATEALEGR